MGKNEFVSYIHDLLSVFALITTRAMFGGYGIYKDRLMVGLIADNELYFKADSEAAKHFESYDSAPFVYQREGKSVKMSYWKVPAEILDDMNLLEEWFDIAYESAISVKKKSKK